MKRAAWGFLLVLGFVAFVAFGCGKDETPGTTTPTDSAGALVGEPCLNNDVCARGFCITKETFKSLTEGKEVEIPGGYCSQLACTPDEGCGPGGFCYSLAQYPAVGIPLQVCAKVCQRDSDCRSGYVCTDGSGPNLPPLPQKACLPPALLCLLDIPRPECPADGGADASSDADGG